jgi:hypothetical protein
MLKDAGTISPEFHIIFHDSKIDHGRRIWIPPQKPGRKSLQPHWAFIMPALKAAMRA